MPDKFCVGQFPGVFKNLHDALVWNADPVFEELAKSRPSRGTSSKPPIEKSICPPPGIFKREPTLYEGVLKRKGRKGYGMISSTKAREKLESWPKPA